MGEKNFGRGCGSKVDKRIKRGTNDRNERSPGPKENDRYHKMFGKPVHELTDLKEAIATYTSRAAEKLRRQSCAAKFIDVFVVTNDYEANQYAYDPKTKHSDVKLLQPTSHTNELIKNAVPLVEKLYTRGSKYLKAGVMLGGLVPDESIQGNIFKSGIANHQRILMEAMDNINFSMRDDAIKYAASGLKAQLENAPGNAKQ